MRIKVSIRKISKKPLHYDYQYDLRAMLINSIADIDVELSKKLHGQEVKFYAFSKILINGFVSSSKYGLNFDIANFIISSPDIELIKTFTKSLLRKREFELSHVKFIIEEVEILPRLELGDQCVFQSLSPVIIRNEKRELYPVEDKVKFCEILKDVLFARYKYFHGIEMEDTRFVITNIKNVKKKLLKIKNTDWRCSDVTFTLSAHPALIKFAHEAGIGNKTSMGFGCVRAI